VDVANNVLLLVTMQGVCTVLLGYLSVCNAAWEACHASHYLVVISMAMHMT